MLKSSALCTWMNPFEQLRANVTWVWWSQSGIKKSSYVTATIGHLMSSEGTAIRADSCLPAPTSTQLKCFLSFHPVCSASSVLKPLDSARAGSSPLPSYRLACFGNLCFSSPRRAWGTWQERIGSGWLMIPVNLELDALLTEWVNTWLLSTLTL